MTGLIKDSIKVLAVNHHPIVAKGIVAFLMTEQNLFIVNTAYNENDALKLTRDWKPNVIVLDVNLPVTNWVQLTMRLRKEFEQVKILAISDQVLDYENDHKTQVIDGFLLKNCTQNEMIEAIIKIHSGIYFYPRQVALHLMPASGSGRTDMKVDRRLSLLTQREEQVLKLMSEGLHNREIAARLRIKVRTVEFHVSNILSKLGVASRMEAVLYLKKSQYSHLQKLKRRTYTNTHL